MEETVGAPLFAGVDVQRDRFEIAVIGWAQVGRTAHQMAWLLRELGPFSPRSFRPPSPRPWLRKKKGRAAQ